MNKSPKKVSVIVPNYNYSKYLNKRLNSIINQDYPIYELIILDDCSTDNSIDVINNFINNNNNKIKIKLIINETNSGSVFSQWEKGLKNCSGDYFWIAEADDIAKPNFLSSIMKKFEDKDVILAYSDIERINEKGKIIEKNSRGWVDIFKTGNFDKDFILDGNIYIQNYLSVLNTILNVSSVVFKKGDYEEIFEMAKEYKVAGDWYIYANILKNGKVAYISSPLSMQRKHSLSVSTTINKDFEMNEINKIYEMIEKWYPKTKKIEYQQNIRKSFMYDFVSDKIKKELDKFKRKRIAFVFPYPVKGSGGHRTVIQNANALINYGHLVDIYVEEDFMSTNREMKKMIEKFYGKCLGDVYVGLKMRHEYDLVFATAWTTAKAVKYIDAPKKAYFIQDFEPWFEPMGNSYIAAENTYGYGFNFITIGRWLSYKMNNEFHEPVNYFDFCADLKTYKKLPNIRKEKAICFIYQPEKWRRCATLGIDALRIVKKLIPDVKIYLYGSQTEGIVDFEAENLHIIPIDKCNEIYNKCQVGLCISSSNPSRIPFEMMAAGLPVVELYRENNLYDMPNDGVLLSESNPEAIAAALIKILNDKELQKNMSNKAYEYMNNKDLSYGFEQFTNAVMDIFDDNYIGIENIEQSYLKEPIKASLETLNAVSEKDKILFVSNRGFIFRNLVKFKKKLGKIKRRLMGR